MSLENPPSVLRIHQLTTAMSVAEDLRTFLMQRNPGAIPLVVFQTDGATDFVATDTLTIGVDVYEFIAAAGAVAADTNIAVEIDGALAGTLANLAAAINAAAPMDHANITLLDLVTPAIGQGSESVVAEVVGTTLKVQYAESIGGDPHPGNPSILLAEAVTANAAHIWSVGNVNLNTLAGAAPAQVGGMTTKAAITAAMIANGLTFEFPFAVSAFIVQVRTAAGVIRGVGADAFALVGNGVAITFGGGVAPDIQPTDIVTITANP